MTLRTMFLFWCDESMAKYEVKVAEKIIEVKIKPEKFQIQLVKMLHFSVKTSLKN